MGYQSTLKFYDSKLSVIKTHVAQRAIPKTQAKQSRDAPSMRRAGHRRPPRHGRRAGGLGMRSGCRVCRRRRRAVLATAGRPSPSGGRRPSRRARRLGGPALPGGGGGGRGAGGRPASIATAGSRRRRPGAGRRPAVRGRDRPAGHGGRGGGRRPGRCWRRLTVRDRLPSGQGRREPQGGGGGGVVRRRLSRRCGP